MKNLDAILQVEGWTAWLSARRISSADMGFAGNPQHPEVQHTKRRHRAHPRRRQGAGHFDGQQRLAQLSGGRALFGRVDTTCWRGRRKPRRTNSNGAGHKRLHRESTEP
ncbi:hypothetical protein J4732_03325 [Serratia marcescens]|uniref:Uncharacterized protein n=1 Tax=Serratia marcescens TaxID=615 RepID=A0A939NJG1_SERMA|nr:hypothetical protein [Serratia marcescens]